MAARHANMLYSFIPIGCCPWVGGWLFFDGQTAKTGSPFFAIIGAVNHVSAPYEALQKLHFSEAARKSGGTDRAYVADDDSALASVRVGIVFGRCD
jgi:hypothetical protein